jgi:cysteinyl-tRNA synthetase
MFDTIRRANAAVDSGDLATASCLGAAVREMCAAFGLTINDVAEVGDDIVDKAKQIDVARAAKDFATADALRNELQAAGYVVETTKDGTRVRQS